MRWWDSFPPKNLCVQITIYRYLSGHGVKARSVALTMSSLDETPRVKNYIILTIYVDAERNYGDN